MKFAPPFDHIKDRGYSHRCSSTLLCYAFPQNCHKKPRKHKNLEAEKKRFEIAIGNAECTDGNQIELLCPLSSSLLLLQSIYW